MLCFIISMTSSRESLLSWRRKGYREGTTSLDKQYLSKVLVTIKMLKNIFNLHSTFFIYIKQTLEVILNPSDFFIIPNWSQTSVWKENSCICLLKTRETFEGARVWNLQGKNWSALKTLQKRLDALMKKGVGVFNLLLPKCLWNMEIFITWQGLKCALGEIEAAEEQEWILGKTTQVCQLHYFFEESLSRPFQQ